MLWSLDGLIRLSVRGFLDASPQRGGFTCLTKRLSSALISSSRKYDMYSTHWHLQYLILRPGAQDHDSCKRHKSYTCIHRWIYSWTSSFAAVTEIWHDSMGEIKTSDCHQPGCYKRIPQYNLPDDSILKIMDRSRHCRQFIKVNDSTSNTWISLQYCLEV